MTNPMMALVLAGMVVSGSASAQSVVALLDGNRLAVVDAKAMQAGQPVTVSGVEGTLVGIDVRPADGMLYGLFDDGTVATIDAMSGKATRKSKLDIMLAKDAMATVDFNPVADRLRVVGSDGTNLRANVDDGKVTRDGSLKFADADMNKGTTPKIVAGAYTNSMKGSKETALYDIDAATGTLVKQAPPNDGVLVSIGKLGVTGDVVAFDIVVADPAANQGWIMAGDTLYSLDLSTGKATAAGRIGGIAGKVRDIAVMPAM